MRVLNCCVCVILALFFATEMPAEEPSQQNNSWIPCLETIIQKGSAPPSEITPKWNLFADVLYWQAGIIGSAWSFKASPSPLSPLQEESVIEFAVNLIDFDWDVGCRTGIGYHTEWDDWEVRFAYTWFQTKSHELSFVDSGTGEVVSSAFVEVTIAAELGVPGALLFFLGERGSIQWNLLYNMIDFEINRNFPASERLSLLPSLGIRGGWIHQYIHTYGGFAFHITSKEILKNDFYGLGPKGGLSSQWDLGSIGENAFHLFGDFSTALLWGQWSFSDVLRATDNVYLSFKIHRNNGGALMMQGLMGLGWSRRSFLLRLSYEMQAWFNQLQLMNAFNGRYHNTLTLQGGVFDVSFQF